MSVSFLPAVLVLVLGAGAQPRPKTFTGEVWGLDGGTQLTFYRVFDGSKVVSIGRRPTTSISFAKKRELMGIGSRIRVEIAANPVDPEYPGVLFASRIEYLTAPAEPWVAVEVALKRLMGYFAQQDPDALKRSPDLFGTASLSEEARSFLIDLHSRRQPKARWLSSGFGGWAIVSRQSSQVEIIHSGVGAWRSTKTLRVVLDCSGAEARIEDVAQASFEAYADLIVEPAGTGEGTRPPE